MHKNRTPIVNETRKKNRGKLANKIETLITEENEVD